MGLIFKFFKETSENKNNNNKQTKQQPWSHSGDVSQAPAQALKTQGTGLIPHHAQAEVATTWQLQVIDHK